MSRISRGFHRVGVVVAVPIAIVAIVMGVFAYQERSADIAAFELSAAQRQASASKRIFEFKDERGATFEIEAPTQEAAAVGFERFKWMAPAAPPPPPGFAIDSEPGPWAKYPRAASNAFSDLIPKPPQSSLQYFGMSLLTLALAVAAYLAIRSIGWVIDGFMHDQKS